MEDENETKDLGPKPTGNRSTRSAYTIRNPHEGSFVPATVVDADLLVETHSVRWNAAGYLSGVYLCQMQAGTYRDTKKLFLLK